jgi:hypothetical protein
VYALRRRPAEPVVQSRRSEPVPRSVDVLLHLQRTAGNQAVARLAAPRPMLQRHGPGFNNHTYREAPNCHFERHLADWERVFGITSEDEVREIAKYLFELTKQDDWENRGGNYGVVHSYKGGKVALAWGEGGIVSCYPKERNPAYAQKKRGGAPARGAQMGGFGSPYERERVGYQPKQREAQQPAPAWAVPAAASGGAPQQMWPATTPAWGPQPSQDPHQGQATATASQATATPPTVGDPRQVEALTDGAYAVYKGYTWMKNGGQLFWWDPTAWTWKPRHEGDIDWLRL